MFSQPLAHRLILWQGHRQGRSTRPQIQPRPYKARGFFVSAPPNKRTHSFELYANERCGADPTCRRRPMKAQALALSGILLMAPCERPPVEYQGESVPAVVLFAEPGLVDAVCREAVPMADDRRILACTHPGNSVMLLPDPCLYADRYAELVCHERAHLRRADGSKGWVHA